MKACYFAKRDDSLVKRDIWRVFGFWFMVSGLWFTPCKKFLHVPTVMQFGNGEPETKNHKPETWITFP